MIHDFSKHEIQGFVFDSLTKCMGSNTIACINLKGKQGYNSLITSYIFQCEDNIFFDNFKFGYKIKMCELFF